MAAAEARPDDCSGEAPGHPTCQSRLTRIPGTLGEAGLQIKWGKLVNVKHNDKDDAVGSTPATVLAFEQHFSPAELGKLWHLSPHFIRHRFKDEPGVIRIDRPEEMHKRGYLTIRIPVSVAQRVHQQLRAA